MQYEEWKDTLNSLHYKNYSQMWRSVSLINDVKLCCTHQGTRERKTACLLLLS